MTKLTHTPGRWHIARHGNHLEIQGDTAPNVTRSLAVIRDFGDGVVPVMTNAVLIAAAPDLLAALVQCRDVLDIRDDFVPLGAAVKLAPIIRAAIDLATTGE